MNTASVGTVSPTVRAFRFESYGVTVEVTSNEQEVVQMAEEVCRRALLQNVRPFDSGAVQHFFEVPRTKSGTYKLIHNGKRITWGTSRKKFFKFFDSIVRVTVAEHAVDRVFLHAGVVGWKGKAIVIPANSFKGKTSLVAAFVRLGADYYSDDFAVFDKEGLVHPFSRPLAMRAPDHTPYHVTAEELGGKCGVDPLEPGLVLFTEYVPGKSFRPKILTPGQGVMGMIPYTLSIRQRSSLAFSVLNKIASRAIIATGQRGSSETSAKSILNFVDKHVS